MTGLKNIVVATNMSLNSTPASGNPGMANSRMGKSKLAVSLQSYAETLLSDGMPESAISLLTAALMADPGRVSLIHKIGQCLEAVGNEKDAASCYRGSLPDCINERYFHSSDLVKLVKSANTCEKVEYLSLIHI